MPDEAIDSIPASRLPDLLRRMPKSELHRSHARTLARNGFEACFAATDEKRAWLDAVDAFFAREAAAGAR